MTNALTTIERRSTPTNVPAIEPRPPNSEVPPTTTEQRGAADHDGCDGVQGQSHASGRLNSIETTCEQDTGKSGKAAQQHILVDLMSVDIDACQNRGFGIAADRHSIAAERSDVCL